MKAAACSACLLSVIARKASKTTDAQTKNANNEAENALSCKSALDRKTTSSSASRSIHRLAKSARFRLPTRIFTIQSLTRYCLCMFLSHCECWDRIIAICSSRAENALAKHFTCTTRLPIALTSASKIFLQFSLHISFSIVKIVTFSRVPIVQKLFLRRCRLTPKPLLRRIRRCPQTLLGLSRSASASWCLFGSCNACSEVSSLLFSSFSSCPWRRGMHFASCIKR